MTMWNLALIWNLFTHCSSLVAALSLPLTVDLQPLSILCYWGSWGRFLLKWYHPKPVWGLDKAILPPQAVLFTYVHTHTHIHTHSHTVLVCQLIITNCSSHQGLAKWPSLSDAVKQAFPKYHKHTRQFRSRCWFTFVRLLTASQSACSHLLPASIIVHSLMRTEEQTH